MKSVPKLDDIRSFGILAFRICRTDFRNLYIEWKRFGCRWSIWTSFLISQGTLPWQPILWKNGKFPTFIPLAFRNGMWYCYLKVGINSAYDTSISRKNFMHFGPVTPELTELIFERLVRYSQLENAWQSIAYSPLGAVVSPSSEYLWKTLTYWSPECLTAPSQSEHRWTKRGNNYWHRSYNFFRLKLRGH